MKTKNRIRTIFIALFFFSFIVNGCFNSLQDKPKIEQSEKLGTLVIKGSEADIRALNIGALATADVTVSGYGMTDIILQNVAIKDGKNVSDIQIPNIPIGKNRIITIEAKKSENSQFVKLENVVLRKVSDINSGTNTVLVNWASTALGNVYYHLLKSFSYNISSIDSENQDSLESLVNNAVNQATHSALVKSRDIAQDFKNNSLKEMSLYCAEPAKIQFDLTTSFTNVSAQVADPVSALLLNPQATDNQITKICPGTWVFYIKSEGNIAFTKELTLTEGQTLVLDPIVLQTGIGFTYPRAGSYSPVDLNGDAEGFGWVNASWELGSHSDNGTVTFAVYSKNALNVLLEIYDQATGKDALYDYWMEKGSDNIWRAQISGLPINCLYAFRVWGPNWLFDSDWTRGNSNKGFVSDMHSTGFHRFNPNKVLHDPYARELSHDTETLQMYAAGHNGGMYGTGSAVYGGVPRRNYDTGKWAPKSVFVQDTNTTGTKPNIPQKDAIIYEAHLRGLTQHPSSSNLQSIVSGLNGFDQVINVPEAYRGTYKGASYMAPYLKAIGINTIELLPVHETLNDNNGYVDGTSLKGNFWGYMTFGFFAPDRRYAYDKTLGGPTAEFKAMVKAFHDAGIEVYLDVVYNHTGEGGNWGNIDVTGFTSLGGFDVTEYYHYIPSGVTGSIAGRLEDGATGCGNQVNANNPAFKKLVLDSLDYWIDEMGIDGFRFDLAATLGRYANENQPSAYWTTVKNFDSGHPLITSIANKGASKQVKMIAEAWDMWGYPVGSFPTPWAEWNGRFRDAARKYLKGDPQGHDEVSYADAFNGDYNHFNDQGGPQKSINLLVAHDGFTLADLVSYDTKQNSSLTAPFGPSDGGSDYNDSWGSGNNQALRRQRLRNFWVFQMFARGTPMIVYGDELARTQNGNNNPYNLDTVATWNNYNMIKSKTPQTVATGFCGEYHNNLGTYGSTNDINGNFVFSSFVMNQRKNSPALRQDSYSVGIDYKKEDGVTGLNSFSDRCAWIRIKGSAAGDTDYLIFSNMWTGDIDFTIPTPPSGKSWKRIIDTQTSFETNFNCWSDTEAATLTSKYGVKAWSMVVLKAL